MVIFPGKKEKTSKELIEHIILEKYNHYYRLAFSYAHNEEDTKDIVQNGAYKALRSHHTFKGPSTGGDMAVPRHDKAADGIR